MEIHLDLSFFPDHLIPIITNSIEIKSFQKGNLNISDRDNYKTKICVFEYPESIMHFKNLVEFIIQKNSLEGYVVVQDTERENTLSVLKHGDIEQLGILICDFCGAVFNSKDEKYIHQRAHYFF